MRISRQKDIVELLPENDTEAAELDYLWKVIVDCNKFNRKLVPIGEFIPGHKNVARFHIEGEPVQEPAMYAPADIRVYCPTCNFYADVKKGDQIPICCGSAMELMG